MGLRKKGIKVGRKKILIITYYWPPAGGPGVQRWLKFVKYLPEFNIEPIVYIPQNANYPLIDHSLTEDVSEQIKILKQPIKEPYRLAGFLSKSASQNISKGIIPVEKKQSSIEKIMLYIRGNFFIPDARKNWVKPSVKFLSEYIAKENIDTIITTGPPHSLHLIGLKLKEKHGVKWLADFRDPWTTIGYHKLLKLTSRSKQKHKDLERLVLNTADQIIVTSFATKSEFKKSTSKPVEVITNGYDQNSIGNVELDSKFSISHIGSLLSNRNPEILWQVCHDLIEENKDFANDFRLNFIGAVSEDVLESVKKYRLSDYIDNIGYVSHEEAIRFQKKSQVLLLIEINSDDTKCIIPGKLFEYMVSTRPILALGPKDSDVEIIIKETNTGHYLYYDDYSPLKKVILDYYSSFKNKALQSHGIGLQKYSRRSLTESLSKLI